MALSEYTEHIKKMSYEEFIKESSQLYGNTRFQDDAIILVFFKNLGNVNAAAKEIGYATNRSNVVGNSMAYRLGKINVEDYLFVARVFIRAKLLSMDEVSQFLRHTSMPGKNKVMIAGCIVKSAIKQAGGKRKAAKNLKVTVTTINFWLERERKIKK